MTNNEKIIELMNIFEKTKEKFLKDEKEIIRIDINERTLSARLMFHLQILLLENESYKETYKPYSVDCEYNRMNEYKIKTLKRYENFEIDDNSDKIRKIFPDIILHKRKEEDNLIVIEMKKSTSNNIDCKEKDRERLKIMTNLNDPNNFNYTLGVYFEVDTTGNTNHIIEFFVNEKKYKKSCFYLKIYKNYRKF
ncbi:hypothetical protein [Fusobacterium animalis]|uniref:hypothetical protein n=1 Tax=Fusobacterium animalis TaxID=76859 RepID=UPI0002137981|nr:hypothetical protein [Fusobacterium animalis]EGN65275.1 hypothetical protein HMPREF0404_00649 [Fusobacterium animalis 21_1A]